MIPLILSLLSSLIVGFYLKINNLKTFKNLNVIICINYLTAIVLTILFFGNQFNFKNFQNHNTIYILMLGFLMPSIFYILKKSLDFSGIAKTDLFQRISLIIPVSLSFILFNETFTFWKLIAILLSFTSLLLILYKKSTTNGKNNTRYLLLVFFGYGIIDTLFKLIATNKSSHYLTSLLLIFIFCFLFSLFRVIYFKSEFNKLTISRGLILGILNFSNIYFYMLAHKNFAHSPTLVFITMNLGVIIGGTLIGKIYFKEHLNKLAIYGILCALLSVILLSLIQIKFI